MEKLSMKKKLLTIRLYTEGRPYSEIATKAGIAKGTVSNVITELKSGKFPEFGDLFEHLELIRELSIDLNRTRLSPVQAAVGLGVLSRLQELGVEPGEIEGLAALFRTLNTEGTDLQSFTRVALSLEEERKRTGLSVEELEVKARALEESASRLEPLVKEVKQTESALKGLNRNRKGLVEEIAKLEKYQQTLKESVRDKEKRETELSSRLIELEDRAQSADERLTIAREELKILSGLGMSLENLSAFTQRLKITAQRHGMKPEVTCSKLLDELEQLEEGFKLETLTKEKKQELSRIEAILRRKKEELAGINITNERMRQEQSELKAILAEEQRHITNNIEAISTSALSTLAELKAAMSEERRHIFKSMKAINVTAGKHNTELKTILLNARKQTKKDMESIITAAESTIAEQNQNLRSGVIESVSEVNRLRNQALKLGNELGQFNEMIESNKWLKGLYAMVEGDEEIELSQVRVIGITVIRAMLNSLDHCEQGDVPPLLLRQYIVNLMGELERWKV